ncbi:MAG: hypothetical protein HC790_07595 [Acaryochloridaceae cyanobacterium CSU_3_4]|nr:hypothetical protein [Acaryochloridaceae cyanobacterium CSU_3_4]
MASQTKQVWQAVGTNEGDDPISRGLLQLDLAAIVGLRQQQLKEPG